MTTGDHVGLAIDPNTNDLFLRADGNLAIVTRAEAVGQHARQRLKTFEGEWFLDNEAGVAWFSELLGERYNPALAEAVIKAEILNTHGIVSIESFSVAFAQTTRDLRIREIEAMTEYDERVSL